MVEAAQQRSGLTGLDKGWFKHHRWKLLAFYLGVPVLVGIYGAFNNWQLLKQAGLLPVIVFYLAHSLPPWLVTCATTIGVMYALKAVKPSPWIIMGLGSVLACFIVAPIANWITEYYEVRWQMVELHDRVAPMWSIEFFSYMFSATMVWFLVNYIFDRFLGLPRYRYTIPRGYDFKEVAPSTDVSEPDQPGPEAQLPGFFSRIPARLTAAQVLAIKAEQHYIRVIAVDRSYMLLYRFSDAVRELDPEMGVQVHRSYWVSYQGIESVKPRAKKFTIRLKNEEDVPVSAPYHAVVKEAARAHNIPVIG